MRDLTSLHGPAPKSDGEVHCLCGWKPAPTPIGRRKRWAAVRQHMINPHKV